MLKKKYEKYKNKYLLINGGSITTETTDISKLENIFLSDNSSKFNDAITAGRGRSPLFNMSSEFDADKVDTNLDMLAKARQIIENESLKEYIKLIFKNRYSFDTKLPKNLLLEILDIDESNTLDPGVYININLTQYINGPTLVFNKEGQMLNNFTSDEKGNVLMIYDSREMTSISKSDYPAYHRSYFTYMVQEKELLLWMTHINKNNQTMSSVRENLATWIEEFKKKYYLYLTNLIIGKKLILNAYDAQLPSGLQIVINENSDFGKSHKFFIPGIILKRKKVSRVWNSPSYIQTNFCFFNNNQYLCFNESGKLINLATDSFTVVEDIDSYFSSYKDGILHKINTMELEELHEKNLSELIDSFNCTTDNSKISIEIFNRNTLYKFIKGNFKNRYGVILKVIDIAPTSDYHYQGNVEHKEVEILEYNIITHTFTSNSRTIELYPRDYNECLCIPASKLNYEIDFNKKKIIFINP